MFTFKVAQGTMTLSLVALAGLFAVVTGINDGGAVLGTGMKVPRLRPFFGLLGLMAAVAFVPLVTAMVATTFTSRLASLQGAHGRAAMAIAVLAAIAVVTVLNDRGWPTSLTLAIVGAVTGAALGWDLPVSPGGVTFVLVVGLAAPFAGALVAVLVRRMLILLATGATLPAWHRWGFALQCLAYGANDGQKMLAVFMVALGFTGAPLTVCAVIAVLFGLGALYGLPRAGRTLSREIIASRPLHAVSAEVAGGVTVLGCAAAGAPVSMTQALAGALIGAGVSESARRIRWPATARILLAWLLTLPVSGLVAGAAALAVRGVTA
ncbi:hypothetical protein Misp01_59520 [Microtetraspora sp. NBRC 13810]|uniref:inorganic phosphate transporter n=1 Tax=Microtetraspora sp. NBRC 13810 TaxID=3030990 RepID=UPI0024A24287|nr:inorganic phosphate transporter [Microtetraspora sp. NBRC 13810]GLW10824.1 hypothetical protein Misp01_59520 [Microtetraspora sp. NBRC 13810]